MTDFKWIKLENERPPEGVKVLFTNELQYYFVARLDEDGDFMASIICDCTPCLKMVEALQLIPPLYWSFIPGLHHD